MDLLSLPARAARETLGLARLGLQVATLPARLTIRAAALAAEQLAEAIADADGAHPPPPPPPASDLPIEAQPQGPDRVRPAAATRPGGRRRASTPASRAPAATEALPRRAAAAQPAAPQEATFEPAGGSEPAPPHVDEEAVLVSESADPGAEDGAGAEVRVDQPWANYAKMTAAEVIDRMAVESEPVLTVLLLYERSHRARRSVIDACERALTQLASPPQPAPRA